MHGSTCSYYGKTFPTQFMNNSFIRFFTDFIIYITSLFMQKFKLIDNMLLCNFSGSILKK